MPYHVRKDYFGELVEKAMAGLPAQFAEFLAEVPVEIRLRPSARQMRDAGVPPDGWLLGLYVGVPRTRRSVEFSGMLPDVIYIFQEHVEHCCRDEPSLIQQVRITVLHEIGHHFGMSEKDLDELGYG